MSVNTDSGTELLPGRPVIPCSPPAGVSALDFALRESERATGERRGAVDGGGALRRVLLKPVETGGAKLWGDGHLGRGQAHVGSNGVDRDRQAS